MNKILMDAAFQRAPGQCHNFIDFASCRSRNLGTVFRSPATALSPPLRGQCSRPAPSIPRYKLSRVRSTFNSSAPFGFEADTGRNPCQKPVSRANLRRSCSFPGIHSPSGLVETLRIKAFDRFRCQKLISRNPRLSLAKA
jgi:hypothetical protein